MAVVERRTRPRDPNFHWFWGMQDMAPWWEAILTRADLLDQANLRNHTNVYWNPEARLMGVVAELAFAILTDRKLKPVGRRGGDGGADFVDLNGARIDVKGHTRIDIADPFIRPKIYTEPADYYVQVAVDVRRRCAAYTGFATYAQLAAAPKVDLTQYGSGPLSMLYESDLDLRLLVREDLPLPKRVVGYGAESFSPAVPGRVGEERRLSGAKGY